MISIKHNCIFIHIPKTGGTSIENMIWSADEKTESNLWMGFVNSMCNKYQTGGLQHLLASQIQNEVSKDFFNNAFKFTMVRNPWDKVISQFTYMKKRKDLRDYIGMDINCDLLTYLNLINKTKHIQWQEQYKFFLDKNSQKLVDKILRFEDFENEVSKLLNRLGVRFSNIIHSKKGNRRHYSTYYNQETKEYVEEMYSTDIKLLGYRFEDFS